MNKNDKDIRKDIEELEKLMNKIKEQNEEEKRKQSKKPGKRIVRINLASAYSTNFWLNMLISFLINFIAIFGLFKIFNFAYVKNDYYIVVLVFIFTVLEELYRRYLFEKRVKIVLFTSGLIFTLLNLVLFYLIDIIILGDLLSFNNYALPVAFVVIFQIVRGFIKNVYVQLSTRSMLNKTKRK